MTSAIDRNLRRMGYTALEIMIVVMVIGVLGAIALPNISKARTKARAEQARTDLELISNATLQLAWDTGKWPGGLDRSVPGDPEVWDLSTSNAGLAVASSTIFRDWKGPYLPNIPLDPWGSPYFFDPDYRVSNVNRVVVGSFGPNRVGRNQYDEDDIYVLLVK